MNKKILLTILIGVFLIVGVTAISYNLKKEDFKDNVKKLDTKTICDKEKEIKEWKDKKFLGIKIGTYQELRCEEDYLEKDWYKDLDTDLIKEDKISGMVKISNE